MQSFKKRQSASSVILRFFAMGAGVLMLFLLSVVVARAAWGMYDTFKVSVDARVSAEGQLASLKKDEVRLSAAVENFDTPTGIEHEIRDRFGVVKPGEGRDPDHSQPRINHDRVDPKRKRHPQSSEVALCVVNSFASGISSVAERVLPKH
jgi:cell division protein FtsB